MELLEAVRARHSVRAYEDRPIEKETREALLSEIGACSRESGLHMQLVLNEPKAFGGLMARYGKFSGVRNYIALAGKKKDPNLDEHCGYYGEKVVLRAQQLGLNTCWVAQTYRRVPGAFTLLPDEKLVLVIAVGYGTTGGAVRRSKAAKDVGLVQGKAPDWFWNGVEAALLAPTALNQQKFTFALHGRRVAAKAGAGFYTKIDLGIAKYHFELGAGKDQFEWE